MATKDRTESYLSQLDKRELLLVNTLMDTTFDGTKEDAAIKAGYVRGKTVYDKLRQERIQKALHELHDSLSAQINATNLAKRQKIMDKLYRVVMSDKTLPTDVAKNADEWGKFEGSIGTGGHVTNVSVKQDPGGRSEETMEDAVRRISGERFKRFVPADQE